MKYLVTGSSGHLGEGLVRTLIDDGHEVVGLDSKPSPFTTITGSITDRECVKAGMRGVGVVYHAATLHKPHIATHAPQQFIDTNILGTLNLLEEACAVGVDAFIFTSTTSVFGGASRPSPEHAAAWITEDVVPIPRNIYGVTKTAAEDLCHLHHRTQGLNCIVLRTSRFFPEEDDDQTVRDAYEDSNIKANEFLYRRVELEDVVSAHLLAKEHADSIGFGKYIISATTPFRREDVDELRNQAPSVLKRRVPEYADVYGRYGWRMFGGIDRVYDNSAARCDLHWNPQHDFARVLRQLNRGCDPKSELARMVGSKRYHDKVFDSGPYPTQGNS